MNVAVKLPLLSSSSSDVAAVCVAVAGVAGVAGIAAAPIVVVADTAFKNNTKVRDTDRKKCKSSVADPRQQQLHSSNIKKKINKRNCNCNGKCLATPSFPLTRKKKVLNSL